MDFAAYAEAVLSSSATEWNKVGVGGVRGGEAAGGYDTIAVFKPDLSISLAWAIKVTENFQEPWANKFPDPHAASYYVDMRYHGMLVHRVLFVAVDGFRAMLPLALQADFPVVAARYSQFMRLVNVLAGIGDDVYDQYLHRAGFVTTDEPWPRP